MTRPAFRVVSPSGKEIEGYTRKDALYAAAILAEKERRFHGRQEPVAVMEDTKQMAAVWANQVEIWS